MCKKHVLTSLRKWTIVCCYHEDSAIYLRSTTEDLAVILDPNRKPSSLLKRLERFLDRAAAYLRRPGA